MIRILSCVMLFLSLISSAQEVKPAKSRRIICTPPPSPPIVKMVRPVYPKEAKENKISGRVVLNVVINRLGEPRNITVKSGTPILFNSAIEAVRQWCWKPYKLNGQAVEVETLVTVNFEFRSKKPKRS